MLKDRLVGERVRGTLMALRKPGPALLSWDSWWSSVWETIARGFAGAELGGSLQEESGISGGGAGSQEDQ